MSRLRLRSDTKGAFCLWRECFFLQTSFAVFGHCHGVIQEAQRENRESQLTVKLWLVLPLSHLPSLFAEFLCFVADRKSKFPHPNPFVNILVSGHLPSFTCSLQIVGNKLSADWWVAVGLLCFWCMPWAEHTNTCISCGL